MAPLQEQIVEVLARVSRKDKALITPDRDLAADLGIDSPKALQLLMELEERFKLQIEDEDAAKMVTVGDVINFVIVNEKRH